ncbi:MAG: hypothetical protein KME26_21475 [Oscillatoria princeps RMCB-10]|jgi:hypothetical protein|nr:hypothetical protein [Oscillatoria princeps RMCB-10]
MGKRWILGLVLIALLLGGLGVWLFTLQQKPQGPFSLPASALEEPWPVQAGLRTATIRDKIPTVDRVVVVPDGATFLAAIGQWSLESRWPVLIEDETYTPMFIERFKPAEVIRMPAVKEPLPDGDTLRQSMRRAAAAAWGATDVKSLKKTWHLLGWEPPGVVIAWEKDPVWPAAVALAADRGQPLEFLGGNFGLPNDTLNTERWERLKESVERAVKETGYSYGNLGDSIDTVTIVRRLPVKYQSPKKASEQLAVTDGLARHGDGKRWAAVGWIYGSQARAVYQAMCAIFLDPKTAMLYSCYIKQGSWKEYEMNEAAAQLREMGLDVTVLELPEANLQKWRSLAGSKWEYDLIFVNSSGDKSFFNVGEGQAVVADIPKLKFPAAIHFIHSWSATEPEDPNTVGGRWLENGAYVYVGSVNEPYLSAFIPPKLMVKRLLRSSPFLISARQLESQPWKITTVGDPLMIVSKPRQRIAPASRPLQK